MTRLFRFNDWPLRAKMAALLVVASLLPLATWAYIDLRQDQARLLGSMKDLLEARGDQIARELDIFHRSYRHAAERVARLPDSSAYCSGTTEQRAARYDALMGVLSGFPESDPGIRGVALLDAAGRVVIATERSLVGADLADRPVVQAALRGNPIISDPFISSPRTGAIPTIAYMVPMPGAAGKVSCVAVLWLRAQSLWTAVKASNALAGPDSFAVLFDREGIRIAHTYSDDIVFHPGGPLDPATLERLVRERRFGAHTRALLEDVRAFPEQFERARAASPDLAVFRGFAPVSRTWNYGVARRFDTVPWTVFYMAPEATLDAEIARATRERLLLAAGIIAAAGILGLVFADSILRPVRALDRATAAIASGDLSARVQDHRKDELGRLDASFNAMAARIESQARALERSRDELEQQVDERTAELARTTHDLEERDAALHRAHVMARLAHVITRPDGSFERWSDTLPLLIGLAPADMPRSTREWLSLLDPDDRATFRNAAIAAGRDGLRKEVEYRLQRSDGRWINVSQVIEPIPGTIDADGKMRWFSTMQDITEQRRTAEELRESQQLLKSIVDNSAAVIYVKDLAGRYLMVNRRYCDLFETQSEAVIGKSDHELFAKEAADAFRAVDQRVAASGAPLIEEEVVPLASGLRTYVSVKCPLRDRAGRVSGVFGISTDITERKLAETALQASEERTRLIVDTALDAVVTMNADGIITGWNPQAEATFGWTRAEALGRTLAQTIVPERHRAAHRLGLERYLATGEAKVLGKRVELSALHRDGREFDVDLSITPIRVDGAPSFSAFLRDITEQKLARERLHAQLERLTLLDQITRAIGERQDLQSIYLVAIRSLEERLPVDFGCVCRYDPVDGALTVIRVGAHSQALAAELAMSEQSRVEIDQNGLSRCVRGELVYEEDIRAIAFPFPQRLARAGLCALVAAPLRSESRVFGIMVIARREPRSFSSSDCEFVRQLSAHVALAAQQAELHGALQEAYDELRQTQQSVMQQERLRALGQMASGIAHDINNAISPVALYTESLLEREPQLTERGRGYLVTIARAIDDVAATVARMREFYREREPQMLLKAVRLNPLVQQVVDLTEVRWRDMPQQRGAVIDVRVELDPDLPVVYGVESEVREALTNLVFNAVDAMPAGGKLTLRTRSAALPGSTLRHAVVDVADTGVGMDDDTRRRCLEPFFTTKGERGTGLGLAMVYGVAQRHAAEVEIDSMLGRGTTVSLNFPVPAVEPAGAAEPAVPVPTPRLRLLIVDDDPLLLNSLRDSLELDGHSVVAANGGQAGIDAFCAAPGDVDAVITDLGMPYVDGRKVAAAVKAAAPSMPVILLTGWGQRLMAEGDVPAHVDRVLSKPPKLRELRAALAEAARSEGSAADNDSIREKS